MGLSAMIVCASMLIVSTPNDDDNLSLFYIESTTLVGSVDHTGAAISLEVTTPITASSHIVIEGVTVSIF